MKMIREKDWRSSYKLGFNIDYYPVVNESDKDFFVLVPTKKPAEYFDDELIHPERSTLVESPYSKELYEEVLWIGNPEMI